MAQKFQKVFAGILFTVGAANLKNPLVQKLQTGKKRGDYAANVRTGLTDLLPLVKRQRFFIAQI